MKTAHPFRSATCVAGLLFCLLAAPAAFAAIGTPVSPPIRGTVQNIDYVHHAITVDGHTYVVADTATFTGIGGFSVLHVGMPVAITLSLPATGDPMPGSAPQTQPDNSPPVITHITWLPGG